MTARIVDLGGGEGTSGSTSNTVSLANNASGGGDDGGVLPCENRVDEGEKEDATRVSASDVLVEVECLAFLCCKGLGTRVWPASIFATTLATDV